MHVKEPADDMDPDEQTNGQNEMASKSKKRKKSEPKDDESIDDQPQKKRQKAQFKLPKKTPIKMKKEIVEQEPPNENNHSLDDTNDENTDVNTLNIQMKVEKRSDQSQSEFSDANDRIECEEASTSINAATGVNTKKRSKKDKKAKAEKKPKNVEPPGEKPPSDLFGYFAMHIHTGKPHKVQKAFDKLTKHERKRLSIEYNEMVEAYVTHLKKYLASLPKEDAVAYVSIV